MVQAALQLPMSAAEFRAWDETQTIKHEPLRGEVFAMTGAADAHVTVAMNAAMALPQHLRGTPCRTFIRDMKLRFEAADAYFYPDVLVTCSAADAASPLDSRARAFEASRLRLARQGRGCRQEPRGHRPRR